MCHPLAERGGYGHSCAPSSAHSNTGPFLPATVSIWLDCAHSLQLQLLLQVGTASCPYVPFWDTKSFRICQLLKQLQLWTEIQHKHIWDVGPQVPTQQMFLSSFWRPNNFFLVFLKKSLKCLDIYFLRLENKLLKLSCMQPPSKCGKAAFPLSWVSVSVCCFGSQSICICIYLHWHLNTKQSSQFCFHTKASLHSL